MNLSAHSYPLLQHGSHISLECLKQRLIVVSWLLLCPGFYSVKSEGIDEVYLSWDLRLPSYYSFVFSEIGNWENHMYHMYRQYRLPFFLVNIYTDFIPYSFIYIYIFK